MLGQGVDASESVSPMQYPPVAGREGLFRLRPISAGSTPSRWMGSISRGFGQLKNENVGLRTAILTESSQTADVTVRFCLKNWGAVGRAPAEFSMGQTGINHAISLL